MPYESDRDHLPSVPSWDMCRRVPVEVLQQREIWIDANKKIFPLSLIPDGHLDNLIKWLGEHEGHWTYPNDSRLFSVVESPLYYSLVKEQQRRMPTRNVTVRQALKDILLNDEIDISKVKTETAKMHTVISAIVAGLDKRNFEIKKKENR